MTAPQLSHEIEIEAPISRVWEVLTDVAQYPTWNPFVHGVELTGPAPVAGAVMVLDVRWPRGGGARPVEIVREFTAPAAGDDGVWHARWVYDYRGFWDRVRAVHGSRVQTLSQREGGPTIYRSEERFSGWMRWAIPSEQVLAGFVAQAEALKLEAEPRGTGVA